jgi:hypothetical protein
MFAEWFSAKTIAPVALNLGGKLAASAKDPMIKRLGELKLKMEIGFDNYIRHQIDRYSKIKTIFATNIPLQLEDIYINLYVKEDVGILSNRKRPRAAAIKRDDDLLEIGFSSKRIVFTATAGAGKSQLMKYLFLRILSLYDNILPVFVESRDLNEHNDKTIFDFILRKMQDRINGFTSDQLKFALQEGYVVLFLDGYDEVDYDRRMSRSKEILSLCNSNDKLVIYVSSRPDDVFAGWERFSVYRLKELTKN